MGGLHPMIGDLANDREYAKRAQIGRFECPVCGWTTTGKITLPSIYYCGKGHEPTPIKFLGP